MKRYRILAVSVVVFMALGNCLVHGAESYGIENEKMKTISDMAAAEQLGAEGIVKLRKIYEGDFVCRTDDESKMPGDVKKIGRIKIDFEVKTYKDAYAYRMNVWYGFPVKGDEPEIMVTKNLRGKISLDRAHKLKDDIAQKPEEVERVVTVWVEEIIKQGEKNNYEFQPLFGSGNLREALTDIGIQLVNRMPESIEELIIKYPQAAESFRGRGKGAL